MRVSLFGLAAIAFIGLVGCGGDDDSDSAPKADLTAWKETASRTLAGEAERYGAYVDAGDAWSSAAKAKCKSGDTACEKKLPEFTSWNAAAKAWASTSTRSSESYKTQLPTAKPKDSRRRPTMPSTSGPRRPWISSSEARPRSSSGWRVERARLAGR